VGPRRVHCAKKQGLKKKRTKRSQLKENKKAWIEDYWGIASTFRKLREQKRNIKYLKLR
jgi:hypothetical protein